MAEMDKLGFRWVHGIILVVLQLIVNTVFMVFGLTLSLATLGSPVDSLGALAFMLLAFFVLPLTYGVLSVKLSEVFGDGDFPSNIGGNEIAILWIHGLVLTVVMLALTTVFTLFGLTLSFAILGSALDSLTALAFVIVAFIALPITYGLASHELTDLLS